MARKSRHNLQKVEEKLENPLYKAGIYARVSVEENVSGWGTIEIQEQMAKDYIDSHEDVQLVQCYADNGVSSFSLHRPAFDKMIADISSGRINCVIVKDISRFGREYLQTFEYIGEIFPSMNVRFISLLEQYDSANLKSEDDLKMPLMSIFNYYYSADLSKKVSTIVRMKQYEGSYVPPYIPFGYKKMRQERQTIFEIDEEKADIVRMMFRLSADGISGYEIAKRLNKAAKYLDNDNVWTQRTVSRILRNDFYIGTYTARKTKSLFREGIVINIPKDEWITIEDHHPAVIDRELFLSVQEKISSRAVNPVKTKRQAPDFFRGKLYCGDCGRKMKRLKRRLKNADLQQFYYVCPTYLETGGMSCSRKSITDNELKCLIWEQLQIEISEAKKYQAKQVEYEQSIAFKLWLNSREDKIKSLNSRLQNHVGNEAVMNLYDMYVAQESYTKADFMGINELCKTEIGLLKEKITEIQSELDNYWENQFSHCNWVKAILAYENDDCLQPEILESLVERINIKGKGEIEIGMVNVY